jgi:homoaconitase/3-isopropylmalate dehydratase large subunit
MNQSAAIAAAEARADRAEEAALDSKIRLAVTNSRLTELEAAAAIRQDAMATAAVRQLVTQGAIRRDDAFQQHEWKAQFLADAALIPLAIGRTFNQKRRLIK